MGLRPFNCCVHWTVLKQETKAAALLEDLVSALPLLCRDQVRAMNAQAVLPAPDVEEDADLDDNDGFDTVQLNDAVKINAKRLQLAKGMVTFLEEHPTSANVEFNAACSSHVQALKKMEAPKMQHRVLTAGRQWGRGNLGNKSAWEKASKAFKEKQDKQMKALEKEEDGERKAEETRREHQRDAPRFIRLLIAAADNSAKAIDASLTDPGIKTTLEKKLKAKAKTEGKKASAVGDVAPPADLELDGIEMTMDTAVVDAVLARSGSPTPTAAAPRQSPRLKKVRQRQDGSVGRRTKRTRR